MQSRSDLWKSIVDGGDFTLETKAVIDQTVYTSISAPVIERALADTPFGIGKCVSATLRLSILTDDEIPVSAEIVILQRVRKGSSVSEWLQAGTFYISRREEDPVTGLLTFTCYDAMLKADKAYVPDPGEFPMTVEDFADLAAEEIGVDLDARSDFPTITGSPVVYYNDMTLLEMMEAAAGICGGSFVITPEGKLRFVPLAGLDPGDDDPAADPVTVWGVTGNIRTGNACEVSGFRGTADGTEVMAGTDNGYVVDLGDNRYLTQAILTSLLSAYGGFLLRPFEMGSAIYDPAAEVGDIVCRGNDFTSILYEESVSLNTAFRGSIKAPESAEIQDEYPYKSKLASAIQKAETAMKTAEDASETASGKNAVFYQTSAPSGSGYSVNDIWFDTDGGNQMYYWNGSSWAAKQFGTASIADDAITVDKIYVNSLSAISANMGVITAGQISVETIIGSDRFVGLLRTSGGTASHDGGIRMFEVVKDIGNTQTNYQSQFYVGTDGFMFARNAEITGIVHSGSGDIGGWTISSARLAKSTVNDNVEYEALVNAPSSVEPSSNRAFCVRTRSNDGTTTGDWSYPFAVFYDGSLISTKGTIAGWTITANQISKSAITGGYEYKAYLNTQSTITTPSSVNAFAVAVRINDGSSTGSWSYPFRVKYDGSMEATKGSIAGWTIGANTLYKTADGKTTGIQAPSDGTTWSFAAGSANALNWSSAPFRVSHTGELFATGATLSAGIIDDALYFSNSGTKPCISGRSNGTLILNAVYSSGGYTQIGSAVENWGTFTSSDNVHVQKALTSSDQARFRLTNSASGALYTASGALQISGTGAFGLYNITNSRWIIYDKGGVVLPSDTEVSGEMYFSKSPIMKNNYYWRSYDSSDNPTVMIGVSSGDRLYLGPYNTNNMLTRTVIGNYIDSIYCFDSMGSQVKLSTAISDRRLKHDISDLTNFKDFIMGLEAKKFKMNGEKSDRHHWGFIAQDVRPLMESTIGDGILIAYNPTAAESEEYNPNDESTFNYSMDYTQFIAPLVSVVQDQQKEIDRLHTENRSLKDDLTELRGMVSQLIELTA